MPLLHPHRAVAGIAALALAAGILTVAAPATAAPPLPAHGTYTQHTFYSDILGRDYGLSVYTPPQYTGKKPLPTTYAAPGGCRPASSWTEEAGLQISDLDELFLTGQAVPQVVVLVDGIPGASPFANPADDVFPDVLVEEIVPFIEQKYKVLPSARQRAVAGNSCGGVEALNTVLQHPTEFSELGLWSTGYFPSAIDYINSEPELIGTLSSPTFPAQLKYVEARIGADDTLAGPGLALVIELLAQHGVDVDEYEEFSGVGHNFEAQVLGLLGGVTGFHR